MITKIEVGQVFSFWQVISQMGEYCLCFCLGCQKNKKKVRNYNLRKGISKSCGCQKISLRIETNIERYGVEHAQLFEEIKEKRTSTCLEKYGSETPLASAEIREKAKETMKERYGAQHTLSSQQLKEKVIATNLQNYGVEYVGEREDVRIKQRSTNLLKYGKECVLQIEEVRQKQYDTNLKKYGKKIPIQNEKISEKQKDTMKKRYGVEYALQSLILKQKMRDTMEQRYGGLTLSSFDLSTKMRETCRLRYGVEIPNSLPDIKEKIAQTNLQKYGERCSLAKWYQDNPYSGFTSKAEQEIFLWTQDSFSNVQKYRIRGNELDIFIPELNLGIEYNGLYWHSEAQKDKSYHLNKTKFFKEKGIRVIHIFEHEWRDRQEQVKSFIQSAINKNKFKIGARKCSFIWTDSKKDKREVSEFLDTYHIQGKCSFSYAIKVSYKGQLIGVATFGKHHRNSKDWVLSRFCTKRNYTIQGGLAKISKLAVRQLQEDLISWAHYRLSDGKGYLKAGWKYEELLRPDYFYHKGSRVISKQSRQKKKVGTPSNMTEYQHAQLDELERVWDCGKIRFRFERTKVNDN